MILQAEVHIAEDNNAAAAVGEHMQGQEHMLQRAPLLKSMGRETVDIEDTCGCFSIATLKMLPKTSRHGRGCSYESTLTWGLEGALSEQPN